jgi:hypothetical protein
MDMSGPTADVLPDISEAFDWDLFQEALLASHEALHKWIVALTPFAKFSAAYIKRHPTVALSVLGVILLIFSIRIFLRSAFVQGIRRRWASFCGRVRAKYTATQAWVAHKSRLVAMIAPHLLFAGFVLALNQFAPFVVEFLLTDDAFLVICGVLPLAAAALTLAASQNPDPASVHYWVKYLAIFQFINFLFGLPFMGMVESLPFVTDTRKALMYWMLIPLVDATDLVFRLLSPLLGPLIQLLPVNLEGGVLGMGLRALVAVRVISENTSNVCLGVLRGGIGALIAIPFLFSLGSITHLGGDVVGIIYPALMSLGTTSRDAHLHWLAYWVLFCVVYTIDLLLSPITSWIPFFNHARLLLFVALQLPQLRAAERVLRLALGLRVYLRPARQAKHPAHQSDEPARQKQTGDAAHQNTGEDEPHDTEGHNGHAHEHAD